MVNFGELLKTWSLQSNNVTRQITFNWKKVDKNAKNGQFWNTENCGQIVLPDRSLLIRQKLPKNAKIRKLKMRHFKEFSNTVHPRKVSVIPTFASFFIFHNFFSLFECIMDVFSDKENWLVCRLSKCFNDFPKCESFF